MAQNKSRVAKKMAEKKWVFLGKKLDMLYSQKNKSIVENKKAKNTSIVVNKHNDSLGATVVVSTLFISQDSLYKGLGFW